MSINRWEAEQLASRVTPVQAVDRTPLGHLGDIYVDEDTQEPVWATVVTQPRSPEETFVPLDRARVDRGALVLDCSTEQASGAPRGYPRPRLSEEQQHVLLAYYTTVPPTAPLA